MQFGVASLPRSTADVVSFAQLAESEGFDLYGVADSQTLCRELYTILGVVLRETKSITVGPMVTNPVTRHPVVTASAMCTANEISGGRAVLGLGSGDSAVYTLGKTPASLDEMESTIKVVKALARGERVKYENKTLRLEWIDGDPDHDLPIALAGGGPKTLRTAGRVADTAILGLGVQPKLIHETVDAVEQGARDAGRDPEDVEKWLLTPANIRDDRERAVDELKVSMAASAHLSLQHSLEGKHVAEEYREPLLELVERYDSDHHGQQDRSPNRDLVDELGVADYLANRLAVVGTPDACIEQLREIDAVGRVDGVLFFVDQGRERRVISRFGEDVLPYV